MSPGLRIILTFILLVCPAVRAKVVGAVVLPHGQLLKNDLIIKINSSVLGRWNCNGPKPFHY